MKMNKNSKKDMQNKFHNGQKFEVSKKKQFL